MAAGKINLQKASGGITKISSVDGTGVTELVVPESGNLVSVDTAVTDNSIARYDGTTGKLQNSGVIIDDNGNIGISTTPSAWRTQQKAIEIGLAALSNFNGLENATLSANMYVNSSNQFLYKNNGYASYYSQSGSLHEWYTSPSGTAGNVIPFTNAMTLNNNGNLLVGTSTDNGVDKLQVNGNISYTTKSGRSVGTSLANVFITNTNSHTLTTYGNNRPLMLEIVNPNSGTICIPIYPFGGSGIKFVWNILNPATGVFVNNVSTQDLNLTVTDKGNYPNTYTITLNGGNSHISIQATTLNAWFYVYLTTM